MSCLLCNEPSDTRLCPACAALDHLEVIRRHCARAASTSPLDLAREIMAHPRFPVAGQAHHALVAAVLVTAWRNATGTDAAEQLDLAIQRANGLPAGFCAGYGADAAAIACGVAVSVIEGNTIKAAHAPGRARAHALTGMAMLQIASGTGNRCCKRSVYGVLELATSYFGAALGVTLAPASGRVACPFTEANRLCNREACRYFPPAAATAAAPRSRLAVVEDAA